MTLLAPLPDKPVFLARHILRLAKNRSCRRSGQAEEDLLASGHSDGRASGCRLHALRSLGSTGWVAAARGDDGRAGA